VPAGGYRVMCGKQEWGPLGEYSERVLLFAQPRLVRAHEDGFAAARIPLDSRPAVDAPRDEPRFAPSRTY